MNSFTRKLRRLETKCADLFAQALFLPESSGLRRMPKPKEPSNAHPLAKINATPQCSLDVLLVDVSPSMEETDYAPCRLTAAKLAGRRFLEQHAQFNPQGLVGIVSFCSEATVIHRPVPGGANCYSLVQSLDLFQTNPNTNISAGLEQSQDLIDLHPKAAQRRIILLSDGEANTGPPPIEVAQAIKDTGTQIDVVGIGGSPSAINEPDLKQIASLWHGQRRYWFIWDVPSLVKRFESFALAKVN